MTEENKEPSNLGKWISEWHNSDSYKEIQKANQEAKQRAVGKYFMLSEEDKLDMVQAICTIMCNAEREGTSHRGLMDKLGIYPTGFWIDNLMDCHNALWSYYHDKKREKEFKDDLDTLDNFIK